MRRSAILWMGVLVLPLLWMCKKEEEKETLGLKNVWKLESLQLVGPDGQAYQGKGEEWELQRRLCTDYTIWQFTSSNRSPIVRLIRKVDSENRYRSGDAYTNAYRESSSTHTLEVKYASGFYTEGVYTIEGEAETMKLVCESKDVLKTLGRIRLENLGRVKRRIGDLGLSESSPEYKEMMEKEVYPLSRLQNEVKNRNLSTVRVFKLMENAPVKM